MTTAHIYSPDKNPMQSGKAKMSRWKLVFTPESKLPTDPLMGWTSMHDTLREVELFFSSKEAAVAYAQKNRLAYEIIPPKPRPQIKKAYADNFKYKG